MTDEHDKSDPVDRSGPEDCQPDTDDKELRTDGGVAVDGTATKDTHPAGAGPTATDTPRSPANRGPSVDGSHPENSTERDSGTNPGTAEPKETVTEHFSRSELRRLETIAASADKKSAWVIKRLLRQRED